MASLTGSDRAVAADHGRNWQYGSVCRAINIAGVEQRMEMQRAGCSREKPGNAFRSNRFREARGEKGRSSSGR